MCAYGLYCFLVHVAFHRRNIIDRGLVVHVGMVVDGWEILFIIGIVMLIDQLLVVLGDLLVV